MLSFQAKTREATIQILELYIVNNYTSKLNASIFKPYASLHLASPCKTFDTENQCKFMGRNTALPILVDVANEFNARTIDFDQYTANSEATIAHESYSSRGDRDCGYTLSWYSGVSLMASSSARLHPASKPCRTATAPRNIPRPNSGRSGTLSVARVMRMESRCSTAPPGHGRMPPWARPSSTASPPSPRVAVTRKKGPAVRRHTRMPCARDDAMMSSMVGRGAVGRAVGIAAAISEKWREWWGEQRALPPGG